MRLGGSRPMQRPYLLPVVGQHIPLLKQIMFNLVSKLSHEFFHSTFSRVVSVALIEMRR